MIPEKVRKARERFREAHHVEQYSGALHLATTLGVTLVVVGVSAAFLDGVTPLEWLTVPAVFLYANLSEYLGHRGPMHHKTPLLGLIFWRHTLEHHTFFTREAMTIGSVWDFKAVLFPPIMLAFFFGCFALPVAVLIYVLVSLNVALLFVIVSALYFLNYELLHLAYHLDPDGRIGRLPLMKALRRHHTMHHDPKLMTRCNFNITYPICDNLFGTVCRREE